MNHPGSPAAGVTAPCRAPARLDVPAALLGAALALAWTLVGLTLVDVQAVAAYEQRFNCGGPSYVDSHSNTFEADRDYTLMNGSGRVGGWSYVQATYRPIGGTPDEDLYVDAGYQWSEYRFDLPNDTYLVRLHFADLLSDGPGLRFFDVTVEDSLLLEAYDVALEAGDPNYVITRAAGLTVSDGQLNVMGDPADLDLFLSAIEVVSWPAEMEPPVAPANLVAWPSYHQVSLDWDDNDEIDLAGYILERSEAPGGPYLPLAVELIPNSRHHDVTAVLGTTYYYRVSAVDIWGNQGVPGAEVTGFVRDDVSSNLPVYEIEMAPGDYLTLLADPHSDVYQHAAFRHDGQEWSDVGVRFRGRHSRNLPKKSWKIKFNEFVPGQRFLDDQEELNLNAHHGERTLMREVLAWQVNLEAGVPASASEHAHLQLNGSYMGVFTATEQIDERWLERHGFNSSGNLYKAEQDTACMQVFADSLTYTLFYGKKTNRTTGHDDIIAFIELINSTPAESLYHTLAPIFDIEGFINYYATQIALGNDSFFCHNYYLYHDLQNDMWHYLPWDLDSTFGHQWAYMEGPVHITTTLKGNAEPTGGNGLIHALNGGFFAEDVPVPHFRRRYLERVVELLDEVMGSPEMDPHIDAVHGRMLDDARLDWHKWGWEDPTWVEQGNVELKNYTPNRTAYVQNQVFNLGFIMPDQDLFINEIMTDNDTGLQDEAGDFDDWFELVNTSLDTIPLAGMYLTDNIAMPTKWALPDTVILPGEYLIFWADNEILEGPTHTNFRLDYEGEFLGLFDPIASGNQPVDTKSWGFQYRDVSYGRLPDGGYNWTRMPTPTPGAANTEVGNLPPLVGPTTHAPQNVGLGVPVTVTTEASDANGIETVTLQYDAGSGQQIVSMTEQGVGVWSGEIPGQPLAGVVDYYVVVVDSLGASSADPRDAPVTTFSYQVAYQPPPLVINEFMALNNTTIRDEFGEFDDWVEIYNLGPGPVALAGLRLSDNFAIPDKFAFPDTILSAGDFLLVWCDNDPQQGWWHASFRLSAAGEELGLFGAPVTGFAFIDSLTFAAQAADTSFGRCPDGGLDWELYFPATPRQTNGCGTAVGGTLPAVPRRISLGPVAPNPFRRRMSAAVAIPFALPDRRRVVLRIYDVTGRVAARIIDEVYDPGFHQLMWDGRGVRTDRLASGVYFIQLRAGDASLTTKITLLR